VEKMMMIKVFIIFRVADVGYQYCYFCSYCKSSLNTSFQMISQLFFSLSPLLSLSKDYRTTQLEGNLGDLMAGVGSPIVMANSSNTLSPHPYAEGDLFEVKIVRVGFRDKVKV
jgi:hypothetical protein